MDRKRLLRLLEAALRKNTGAADTRWALKQTGMTDTEIRTIEHPIRRRIKEERGSR